MQKFVHNGVIEEERTDRTGVKDVKIETGVDVEEDGLLSAPALGHKRESAEQAPQSLLGLQGLLQAICEIAILTE